MDSRIHNQLSIKLKDAWFPLVKKNPSRIGEDDDVALFNDPFDQDSATVSNIWRLKILFQAKGIIVLASNAMHLFCVFVLFDVGSLEYNLNAQLSFHVFLISSDLGQNICINNY